jgi:hypothetical protein
LNGVKNQKIMKENIELTHLLGGNATTVEETAIMPGTVQKEEEGQILEEDIIAEEDIEVDLEVAIIEEDIQDQEVLDQEVIEEEVIEDTKDIKAKAEVGVEEIVAFLEEVRIVKEVGTTTEINPVEVIVLKEAKNLQVISVNKIEKIIRRMKKIIKMEMKR